MLPSHHGGTPGAVGGSLEDDPEYALIVASNQLVTAIDAEIAAVHRFVADLYGTKFAELEKMVSNAIDYFRVVQTIGNETVGERGLMADG